MTTTIASDAFARTVSGGWGTADTGGAWTPTNSTYFSANGSAGLISTAAGSSAYGRLAALSASNVELTVTIPVVSPLPAGGTLYYFIHPRSVSESAAATTSYGVTVTVSSTGAVNLYSRVNGVSSNLVATGLTVTTSDSLKVRARVTGANPTTIQARVWKSSQTEPATWALTVTDSTSGLQVAGAVALGNYLSSTATNGPISTKWDALTVTDLATTVSPTVSAGPDKTGTTGSTVTVTGTATESGGTITSDSWTFAALPAGATAPTLTGSAAGLNTASVSHPVSFTATTAGTYMLQYKATDAAGTAVSDTVAVTMQATAPPAANGTLDANGWAVIDCTSSTPATGGSLTYAISPAATQFETGKFLVPLTTTQATWTVTIVESGGGTSTAAFVAPIAGSGGTGYTGKPITLVLPTPEDPSSNNTWGATENAAFQQLEIAVNGLIGYFNTL